MNGRTLFAASILLCAASSPAVLSQESFLGRSVDQWSEAVTSSDGQKRAHASWAIAQLASRAAGGPQDQVYFAELVKLLSDNDPTVRYWGVMGLASYAQRLGKGDGGQTAVINTLQPMLDDKAAAPRIAAAQSLGLLGKTDQALPVLVAAMSDPQESVRIQAVAALDKLGPAARPAETTLRKATSDPSEYVKRISGRAVARLDGTKK